MPKAISVTSDDLMPAKSRQQAGMRQRGVVPSAELVPMQFRMPPDFVKAFKQAALDRNMKLNEMLETAFQHFMKTGGSA